MAVGCQAFYGCNGGARASPQPDDRDRWHCELGEAGTTHGRVQGGRGGVTTTTTTTTATDEAATWTATWSP